MTTEIPNKQTFEGKSSFGAEFLDASSSFTVNEYTRPSTLYSTNSEEEEEVPLWLITFTDVMALMLTFFVLLYSMSVPEYEKWEDMTKNQEQGYANNKTLERFSGQNAEISIDKISMNKALDLNYLSRLINDHIKKNDLLQSTLVFQTEDSLIVSLPTDVVFTAGSANISSKGRRALFSLGGVLHKIKNRIEVIGHADPRKVSSRAYQSNWDLSLSRAMSAAGVLSEVGYKRDITARGLSNSRYDEIPEDVPRAKRMDMSRRVDIVIMRDNGERRPLLNFGS